METAGASEGPYAGDVDDGAIFGCKGECPDVGSFFEGVVREGKPIFPKVVTGEALSTADL
jgi:hypothetical protein